MHLIKKLDKLPPKREKVETLEILRQLSKSSKALGRTKLKNKISSNLKMKRFKMPNAPYSNRYTHFPNDKTI